MAGAKRSLLERPPMMAKVLSIVSGKGGSGKSLFTAIAGRALAREGRNVLLVDMDIFVRGLTILASGLRAIDKESSALTVSQLLGVFAERSEGRPPIEGTDLRSYAIVRLLECDVLPAVDNIGAPLDYDDTSLSDESFCNACVKGILDTVRDKYDYILLDNRAGMDSLVSAACRNSDIVIAVAEDDDVGRQTNVNLVRFIQSRKKAGVVYSIINKGRDLRNYPDVRERSRQKYEFTMLGVIPFDIEVMEDFGSDRFWTTVTESLYFRSLIDVWNALAKVENLQDLSVSRYRFPPRIFMHRSQGRFTLIERMLRIYSLLFIAGGAGVWVIQNGLTERFSTGDTIALTSMAVGALMLVLSTGRLSRLIMGGGNRAREEDDER